MTDTPRSIGPSTLAAGRRRNSTTTMVLSSARNLSISLATRARASGVSSWSTKVAVTMSKLASGKGRDWAFGSGTTSPACRRVLAPRPVRHETGGARPDHHRPRTLFARPITTPLPVRAGGSLAPAEGACHHRGMTVVHPGQGRALNPDMTLKVGTQDLPHGSLSVVEGILAPGQYIGPHTHSREDEVTFVLDGQIVALLDDTVLQVNAGSFLLKPAGVMHAFGNRGPAPARVFELHAPGGLEEFYAAMHLNFSDPDLSEDHKHAAFLQSCTEFGLVHHLERRDEVQRRLGL